MEKFVKGDVIVLPFPFSDLTANKKLPAFVLAELEGDDVIVCQITSKAKSDRYSILLSDTSFESGTLHQESFIRPNRLFTADTRIVLYKVGSVKRPKADEVAAKVIEIIEK